MEVDRLFGLGLHGHTHVTRMFDVLWTIWIRFLQALGFDPRGLFAYYDGRWNRRADPMVVARRLWSVNVSKEISPGVFAPMPFESMDSLKLIKSGVGTQIQQGYAEIAQATRYAFQLRPFEQGGLSEHECETLLERYEDWMGDVKKNGSGTPISPSGTDAPVVIPTNSDADGSSISTENAMPMPDVSALESRLRLTQ